MKRVPVDLDTNLPAKCAAACSPALIPAAALDGLSWDLLRERPPFPTAAWKHPSSGTGRQLDSAQQEGHFTLRASLTKSSVLRQIYFISSRLFILHNKKIKKSTLEKMLTSFILRHYL